MSIRDIRARYGDGNSREVVNRAIRAECAGGALLLELIELVHHMRLRNACPQAIMDRLQAIRDVMAQSVLAMPGSPTATPSPPDKPPGLSLDALRRSSLGDACDNRDWTPPAAIVAQMGKISDRKLAEMAGVSYQLVSSARERLGIPPMQDSDTWRWTPAMDKLLGTESDGDLAKKWGMSDEAVRRRREKLGISATKKIQRWTPERLEILRRQTDNGLAANALGISVNAVKVARSRLK